MDLDELRSFLAVVKTGSFASAARELGFARATLRRRVGELESRIGGELFDRSSEGARLTPGGEVFARKAERVIREASALVSSTRQQHETARNSVRLALPRGTPVDAAAMVGGLLTQTNPRLRTTLLFSDEPERRLLFDADIAVRWSDEPIEPPWRAVASPPMFEGAFATRRYLDEHGVPKTLDDLSTHRLFSASDSYRRATEWALRDGGTYDAELRGESNSAWMAHASTLSGRGIGYLLVSGASQPGWIAEPLVAVLPEVLGRSRPVQLIVPDDLDSLPFARALVEVMTQTFANLGDSTTTPPPRARPES